MYMSFFLPYDSTGEWLLNDRWRSDKIKFYNYGYSLVMHVSVIQKNSNLSKSSTLVEKGGPDNSWELSHVGLHRS